jgi:NAD(P)-dependent dehydrogenase (short-subunit alcohol dehydrogenase family)
MQGAVIVSGHALEDSECWRFDMSVVLITGCSTGIGRELARVCAEAGDRVYATMRDPSKAGELEEVTGVTVLTLDVIDDESVAEAVDEVLRGAGRIDVVVNNAGIDTLGAVEDIALDKVREIMETNFFGALRVTRRALPAMRAQGAGTIVMVTSLAAAFSTYGEGAYAASKRALEGAAEVLQNEAARWGIRVLVIRPGYVDTPIAGKSIPGSASPPDSPYRELIRVYGEQDERGVREGAPAVQIAREIRDAYAGGGEAFYVPVGEDARQLMPWRRTADDRQFFEQVPSLLGFEWWVNGDQGPPQQ